MATKRDEILQQMKKTGRVTLAAKEDGDKVYAVGEGGVRFRLTADPGENPLARPTFTDKDGNTWRGRYYPGSGSIHFQRRAQAAAPKSKAKAGPATRAKAAPATPAASKARAKSERRQALKTGKASKAGAGSSRKKPAKSAG
jgi:hypothetical protein